MKGRVKFAAAQLELLDNVADLLEALKVIVVLFETVGYDEERGLLKQQDLVRFDDVGEVFQALFKLRGVWYELVDDLRPSLKVSFKAKVKVKVKQWVE